MKPSNVAWNTYIDYDVNHNDKKRKYKIGDLVRI